MTRKLHTAAFVIVLAFSSACRRKQEAQAVEHPERELTVGFVAVNGVYNTELTAPMDMFQHTVFHTDPGLRVFTVAPTLEPIRTFEGLRILPNFDFDNAPPIDILVVPSAEHSMDSDLENEELLSFVRERGKSARWILSLCDGAFVLAEAGLLDGRQATTFPSDCARLAEMFPEVNVHTDVSFVADGRIITSEGGARSFDAALYICQLLFGKKAADGIAGGLVISWDADSVPHLTFHDTTPSNEGDSE